MDVVDSEGQRRAPRRKRGRVCTHGRIRDIAKMTAAVPNQRMELNAASQRDSRDERNAASNLKKHRVGFGEASTIFDDPWFVTFLDEEHSMDEDR